MREIERKKLDELLMCKCKFSSIKRPHFLPSVFSPFWGENILVGPRRKNPDPTIYFPSSSLNQIHSKKFSFPFSLRNFPSTLFHLQTNTSLVFSFLIVVGVFKVDRWVLISSTSKVFDGWIRNLRSNLHLHSIIHLNTSLLILTTHIRSV